MLVTYDYHERINHSHKNVSVNTKIGEINMINKEISYK